MQQHSGMVAMRGSCQSVGLVSVKQGVTAGSHRSTSPVLPSIAKTQHIHNISSSLHVCLLSTHAKGWLLDTVVAVG